jgi:hypothetical protein
MKTMLQSPQPLSLVSPDMLPSTHASMNELDGIKARMQADLDAYKAERDAAVRRADDFQLQIQLLKKANRQTTINKVLTGLAACLLVSLTWAAAWHMRPCFEPVKAYKGLLGTSHQQFVAVMENANLPFTDANVESLALQLRGYHYAQQLKRIQTANTVTDPVPRG